MTKNKKILWIALGAVVAVIIVFTTISKYTYSNESAEYNEDPGHYVKKEFVIKNEQILGHNDNGTEYFVKNGKILYFAAGSGSCPPVIDEVTQTDDQRITLHVKEYVNQACTMDYRPVHQVIEYKNGELIPDNIEVFLSETVVA